MGGDGASGHFILFSEFSWTVVANHNVYQNDQVYFINKATLCCVAAISTVDLLT